MTLDLTAFDAALKEHYTSDRVMDMVYADNPFLALVSKYEQFGGRNLPIPLIYGNPQGRSATFSQAQTRSLATSSAIEQFTLTRVSDYSVACIDGQTLEASKGDENAFMEAATTEIDGAINSLTRSLAIALYRAGWGKIGAVGSSTGATITLATVEDVTNFEVGQEVVFSESESGHVLRDSGDSLVVSGVNRTTGVITFSENVSEISGLSNSDTIFIKGDRQDSATPTRLKPAGLQAWIPDSAPSSATFFGVDRTADVTRLGGLRQDGSAKPIEEALIDAASLVAREGGKVDHCFLSYAKYAELEKALGSKVQYVDLKMDAHIAFRGIILNGPRGPVKVIPDQNCPSDRAFLLQLDTWKLYSIGKAVSCVETDGNTMLRQSSADGVEVRYRFYGNLGCKAPGYNLNLQLS